MEQDPKTHEITEWLKIVDKPLKKEDKQPKKEAVVGEARAQNI